MVPDNPLKLRVVRAPDAAQMVAAYALRFRVFVEEQAVPIDLERDGRDGDADHVVVFDGDVAVATGRLMVNGDGVAKVQRVAVDDARRGAGLGRVVMDALEERAAALGAHTARLASQLSAVGFYLRLGYRVYGEVFLDAGIEHRWMDKELR